MIDFPVLGPISAWKYFAENACFVLAIGSNSVRETLARQMKVRWYTAIHPSVQTGIDVKIDMGSVIMANTVINSGSRIGTHCIINTGTVIEHDNRISDFVHISPNATLCGTVSVGKRTHIGASAVVKNNLLICEDVPVGFVAENGRRLDIWVSRQRKKYRVGKLSLEQCRRLEAVGMIVSGGKNETKPAIWKRTEPRQDRAAQHPGP